MIKTLFAVIIVIAAGLVGLSVSARITRREKLLIRFQEMLRQAQTRLRCTADTLSNAFSVNTFQFRFSEQESFADQWRELIDMYRQSMKKDDADMLKAFTNGIGEGDLQAQLSHIDLYLTLIGDHIRAAHEEYDSKARLYRTLSFSAGLVIALILI